MEALNMIMTVNDALDRYADEFSEYCDELYWDGGGNENKLCDFLERKALADGYTLDWAPGDGKLVWSAYQATEKGLS